MFPLLTPREKPPRLRRLPLWIAVTYHLHLSGDLCYTVHGKGSEVTLNTQKAPQVGTLGGFLFPYCRQGLTPRLVAVVSLIEPFTDVVGDYTSQDGENKGSECHQYAPPPIAMCRGGNTFSIAQREAFRYVVYNRLVFDTVKPIDFDGFGNAPVKDRLFPAHARNTSRRAGGPCKEDTDAPWS